MLSSRESKSTAVPILGVLAGTLLLAVAAARYPGGYVWLDQSISSLFQPLARNGSPNAARLLAASGLVACCVSLGLVFHAISRRGPTPSHRRAIQIGGVGSMVYAALVVTPMHDLMVWISLGFFVVAMVTIFHWLLTDRRHAMLMMGVVCLSLTLSNAIIYRFNLFSGFLPIVQKLGTVLWVLWLLWFYWREMVGAERGAENDAGIRAGRVR
jgi:hypothetical protein